VPTTATSNPDLTTKNRYQVRR